jgi:hypothetical protein
VKCSCIFLVKLGITQVGRTVRWWYNIQMNSRGSVMRNEANETDPGSCPVVNVGISNVESVACHQHLSVSTLIPTELLPTVS